MAVRITRGEAYQPALLDGMLAGYEPDAAICDDRTIRAALLIAARRYEVSLGTGQIDRMDADLARVSTYAQWLLACAPGQGLGWLALFWVSLQHGEQLTGRLDTLRRAYLFAPHELWIAVRRAPLGVTDLSSLPEDLKALVLEDYGIMLRNRMIPEALRMLAGPGASSRAELLRVVASQDLGIRRKYATRASQFGVNLTDDEFDALQKDY